MIKNKTSDVVLISTHVINDFVLEKYRKIKNDLSKDYDVILLFNTENKYIDIEVSDDIKYFKTSYETLNMLKYNPIKSTLFPGSCHYPVLRFYLDNPTYSHYWFIEYDVEFTGEWSFFIEDVSQNLEEYDFLSCYVEKYDDEKNGKWHWWHDNNSVGYPLVKCVKAFNTVCRYSNNALKCLDAYQKQGHSAHSEVMITTCLYNHGLKIGDFGGFGEFVPEGFKGKYYLHKLIPFNIPIGEVDPFHGGTIRFSPVYTKMEIEHHNLKNKLFHPYKKIFEFKLKNFYN